MLKMFEHQNQEVLEDQEDQKVLIHLNLYHTKYPHHKQSNYHQEQLLDHHPV